MPPFCFFNLKRTMDPQILRSDLKEIMDQFVYFQTRYQELERRSSRMEADHHADIVDINRANADEMQRFQDMTEVLEAQMALQNETHRAEINRLRQEHQNDIDAYQRIVDKLKQQIEELNKQIEKNSQFLHPALHETMSNKRCQQPIPKKKAPTSSFNWPQLDIRKESSQAKAKVNNSRKKLFNANEFNMDSL